MLPTLRAAIARTAAVSLLAGLVALASCGPSPTEPVTRARVHRSVTAAVRDSTGVPAAGIPIRWIAQFDSAGLVDIRVDESDEAGESVQRLADGGWLVTAGPAAGGSRVAGASLVVAGPERAATDTQVVRLVLHTSSRATGTVTLAGRADHSGTIVATEAGALAVTDADGAWTLEGLPLGHWTVTMSHPGFRLGIVPLTIGVPGSSVPVPPVSLVSEP
jgi:hypothetical protein